MNQCNSHTPFSIYGVIGFPLTQSLSPLLHTTSFQSYQTAAVLVPWAIAPEALPQFMNAFRLLSIQGCCVTIPHKTAILPFVDEMSERVKRVGAANTLYWRHHQLCAENTDVAGFVAPLRDHPMPYRPRSALILGAGGAARAVVVGLQELGIDQIFICSPSGKSAQQLAETFSLHFVAWEDRTMVDADLIINATPMGMYGHSIDESPYPCEAWSSCNSEYRKIAYDLIYKPHHTRFLKEAEAAGCAIISGLEMFIAQADAQHHLWIGKPLAPEAIALIQCHLTEAL